MDEHEVSSGTESIAISDEISITIKVSSKKLEKMISTVLAGLLGIDEPKTAVPVIKTPTTNKRRGA